MKVPVVIEASLEVNLHDKLGDYAVSYESARTIYPLIEKSLNANQDVALDFKNLKVVTSQFFNGTIALAASKHGIDKVQKHIKVLNIPDESKRLLNYCIHSAINQKDVD